MRVRILLGIAAMAFAASTPAASIFVRPTTVILAQGSSAATVTVTNSGETPVTAQLRSFSWNQASNEDKLEPTSSLVASPPMMTIAPGKSQTIRVVRTGGSRATKEESYRILVDEIPDRSVADAGSGVQIQLRYSIPVFVVPDATATAQLAVTAQASSGHLVFDAVNRGRSHAQVSNIVVGYGDGRSQTLNGGLVGYVLPDKTRQWRFPLPADAGNPSAPKQVRATVNGKELLVNL